MNFSKFIETVDTHTFGEPTRTVVAGVPPLKGNTMEEKRAYFEEHYDWIRTTVMLEPRGSSAMSGTVLTEPCNPAADIGVIFIDSGGYFPMCGHSTVGVTTMLVETGMVPAIEPQTTVKIDTPAGLVTATATVENGCVKSVTFENVPCFLYATKTLDFGEYGEVEVDVAFGGGSFALIPADPFGLTLKPQSVPKIIELTHMVHKKVNEEIGFVHPEKPEIKGIQQIHWYSAPIANKAANARSANVTLPGVDRSPCGTGTSARAVTAFVKGTLQLGEEFVQESMTEGIFRSEVLRPIKVGDYPGGIPTLTGQAHISGFCKFVIDPDDPLTTGFEPFV